MGYPFPGQILERGPFKELLVFFSKLASRVFRQGKPSAQGSRQIDGFRAKCGEGTDHFFFKIYGNAVVVKLQGVPFPADKAIGQRAPGNAANPVQLA